MYAIIRSGGKQHRVQVEDRLRVELLNVALGEEIELSDVLYLGNGEIGHLGHPIVKNAKVVGVVVRQSLSPKVLVLRRKRRKGYRKLRGHRQPFTEIFIQKIVAPDGSEVVAKVAAHVIDPAKKLERKKKFEEKSA